MLVYITKGNESTSFTATSESFADLTGEIRARFGDDWRFSHSV